MKVGLLGAGKTGSKVLDLHHDVITFTEENPPGVTDFKQCDVIICFLPGNVFLEYIPSLIESAVPVVTGATGFEWPASIDAQLKEKKLKWVRSHNFSLGMNLVKAMIGVLGQASVLYDKFDYNIHDIHHIHKLDAPSGTALSWKDWLGHDAHITAERTGDVVGYHHLELDTPMEKIKIVHEAKDRAIFASGALWTAKKILDDKEIECGLIDFSNLVTRYLNI